MTTTQANEKLVSDLKCFARDAEDLIKATAGEAGDKMSEVRRRLSTALDSAKSTYQQIEEKTIQAAKATDSVIRTHVYESLGIACGVGLLVGFLVGRK